MQIGSQDLLLLYDGSLVLGRDCSKELNMPEGT